MIFWYIISSSFLFLPNLHFFTDPDLTTIDIWIRILKHTIWINNT